MFKCHDVVFGKSPSLSWYWRTSTDTWKDIDLCPFAYMHCTGRENWVICIYYLNENCLELLITMHATVCYVICTHYK